MKWVDIMEKKFTIGEMSKLHNVSIQTLRYYDRIELFEPKYTDKLNNYRYYTIDQFVILETIQYLKLLGMPLKDIKQHLENRNITNSLELLEKQNILIEKKIKDLEIIKRRINKEINNRKHGLEIYRKESKINIKEIPERNIIFINSNNLVTEEELAVRELFNLVYKNYLINDIGELVSIISKKDIIINNLERYNSIGFILDKKINNEKFVKIIPKGKFACIYHIGDYEQMNETYEKIINFIKNNRYEIIDDVIEKYIIDETVTTNKDEYITEIQIPVK